jgi:CheY-like chemotaxis protein
LYSFSPSLKNGLMTSRYTILYIDDDQDDLLIISQAFQKYSDHFTVIHAYHGNEGLEILAKMNEEGHLPCLVILDLNMPVMDGKQTLSEIRKHEDYKSIPIILFSTSGVKQDKEFVENLNADFVTKPIHFSDMENIVKEFVQKCKLEI